MNIAILLAAGKGQRFGGDKLFARIGGVPVVEHALRNLQESAHVDEIVIAGSRTNINKLHRLGKNYRKVTSIIIGGTTRFASLKNAMRHIQPCKLLIIQNGANPFITSDLLEILISTVAGKVCGAAPAHAVYSTVKQRGKNRFHTLPRGEIFLTETPQVVRYDAFIDACNRAGRKIFTDDLEVLEAAGYATSLVESPRQNIKVTTREDLEYARFCAGDFSQDILVGIGEDSHAWGKDTESRLKLAGVIIKTLPALEADSDGDVVLHALCNAISSALGEGSLGSYATKIARNGNRNSVEYLKYILKKAAAKKMKIQQCTISIEAARPKIDPLVQKMKKSLARLLDIPEIRIGITAHTGEKLTPFGRGDAIRSIASVTLRPLE